MYQGDQLKWQSARFAFERHRDRYPDSPISFSLQLFSLPIATQVFCAKQKRLENRTDMQGGLAQVVERSIRIRQAPGWRPGYFNWLFFTIIFIANFNASFLCQTEKVEEQKHMSKWQGLAQVVERSIRIRETEKVEEQKHRAGSREARILQLVIVYNYLENMSLPISTQVCCAKQKRLENRKNVQRGISSSGRALSHSLPGFLFFFTIIFVANCNTSFLCQTEKVGEQKNMSKGISSSGRALDSHSRGTGIDTRILQLVFLYNYFRCQLQHKFFVPNRKGWRIEQICKGDQLKWQSARFAFERHRDRDTDTPIGYSLQLFSLPISTQVCCAKQKRLKNRNNIQGGLAQVVERWIRIREAPGSIPGFSNQFFFTIIFVANCNTSFLCQTEKVGEQKNPIGYSLQLFSLPISTQVCCAKQKRLENRKNVPWGLAQVVERSIRIREAPGSIPGFSNQFFFTIIFVANCNTSFLCQTEKVGEQNKYARGISSSGRALDSHSIGTGMETRILQLVILYNNFHCQFQRKFFVPNRKGWRIETICPRGISSSGRALDSHSRGTAIETPDTPIGYSLQLFSLPISTQVCCAKQKRLKNRNNI